MGVKQERNPLGTYANSRRLNIRNLIITFIIVFCVIGAFSYGLYSYMGNSLYSSAQSYARERLESVKGFLIYLDNRVKNGELTKEEAQNIGREYLNGPLLENGYRDITKSKMGFNEYSYVYAFTKDGIAAAHPYYEGKNIWDYQNEDERYIIREILDEGRYGKTIEYNWKNPGGSTYKAIDYCEYFEPWGWVVGYVGNAEIIYMNKLTNLRNILIVILLLLTPIITLVFQSLFVANTKKARFERQFYYLSHFDSLTGLPNRKMLSERLQQRIMNLKDKNQLIAVMILDIDNFKKINDTLGHKLGDMLLDETSKRIRACINENDIIARQSADEFIIVLTNIKNIKDSTDISEKVLESISSPFNIDNSELFITASIGISIYPYNGNEAETLIKNAGTAMYQVKKKERNSYLLYAASMEDDAIAQIEMECNLRRALNRNELVLYYQPLVEIGNGRIIGMEALLRWNKPDSGILPPARFISLAEETGMIVEMGEWVLNTACRQNKEWQNAGYPRIRVAVNISSKQFEQENFIDTVKNALSTSDLDPCYLELEITEDVIRNVDKVSIALNKLRELGVKISLDDFGTGYSSLSHLKKLPIDTLKIDKSFIHDVTEGDKEVAITTAVITMGHNLRLQVLAEGVETEEQLSILKNYNCDAVQGFYYSKPVAPEEFVKLFKNDWKLVENV
jgi:diguanylate cyclase (GGDEF)-like protein